jgi:hypothetical protein
MPIIGSLSGVSARGLGGLRTFLSLSNDYEAIASTVVVGSSVPHITFSSIPNTYKHLQIRGLVRTTQNSVQNGCAFQLNGDTGSNYAWNQFYTSSGGTPTAESYQDNVLRLGELPSANAPAGVFGFVILDIYDYTSTDKYTTCHESGGSDRNGTGFLGTNYGVWRNTAVVNSVKLFESSSNWAVGSMFSLYGIKG